MPRAFPDRLKQGIGELEQDIKNVEAKVKSLKLQCEPKDNKIIVTKSIKRFDKTPVKAQAKPKITQKQPNCQCCCCGKAKEGSNCSRNRLANVELLDLFCANEAQNVSQLVGRNHVHKKIRVPTGKTWSEILGQGKKEQLRTKRHAEDNKPKRTEELKALQKAVRDAQADKEIAQRQAALQALTLDKMRVLLEAKVACDRLKENTIAAARKTIEEQLEAERRNTSMMQIEAALQQIRAADSSSSESTHEPRYTISINSSRRLRHSSPTPSKISLADLGENWNDVSSIPEYSFSTI